MRLSANYLSEKFHQWRCLSKVQVRKLQNDVLCIPSALISPVQWHLQQPIETQSKRGNQHNQQFVKDNATLGCICAACATPRCARRGRAL